MATSSTITLGEWTPGGLEFRLRPRGVGRFSSAAFLLVWLCFWAAGETIVAYLLVRGAIALITGEPLPEGPQPRLGPALAAGAFMLFWLAFWTVGGIAAMRELLKLLWSEDRIIVNPGGITVVNRLGPVRSMRELPRDTVRRIRLLPSTGVLRAETTSGTVELATLGTLAERMQLAEILRAELGLDDSPETSAPEAVPDGWQEIVDPEGGIALVPDVGTRRTQARVATAVAAVVAVVAIALLHTTLRDPGLIPLTVIACGATAGLGWLALWLALGRSEWRVGSGRLTLRRRFGGRVRDLLEARALELTCSHDGDGDPWFELEAVALHPRETGSRSGSKTRRKVTRSIHDPTEPRRLGLWLAQRAAVPFQDLTTEDRRTEDLGRQIAKLEGSGFLGRLAARLIARAKGRAYGR
jgi:hypothetical protein